MRFATIFKVAAGIVSSLAILIFAALRVDTTGTYARTFDASPAALWRIWNNPDDIGKWWGPSGYTAPVIRNDPRAGGSYLWAMKSPAGDISWITGTYKEVVPNVRLVSSMSFSDADGRAIPGAKVPVPGHWPDQITVTTIFAGSDGKTTVTVSEAGVPFIVSIVSKIAWSQQFDKVEALLRTRPILPATRLLPPARSPA